MNKLASRSFWLSVGILVASAGFTYAKVLDGAQWSYIALGVYSLWQGKDIIIKAKASHVK